MAGGARRPGLCVASRVLSVLGAFDSAHQRMVLADIARRADLPLTTAHRLVAELVSWQALSRRTDGSYEIGRRLWETGLLAPVQRDLRELAQPHLQDVHRTTGETVHLAVRVDRSALYVERLVGRTSTPVLSRTGARLPLHATAVGKVLLAHADEELVAEALAQATQVTPHTVVDARKLTSELALVRRRGYARTAQEMTLGAWSVAVPLCDRSGTVVAAMGLVTGNPRRNLAHVVPVLQVAASAVARALPDGWDSC